MARKLPVFLLALVVLGLALWHGPGVFTALEEPLTTGPGPTESVPASVSEQREGEVGERANSATGFRSKRALDEHFEKHGREFGAITKDEYLRRARELRDAKVGGKVLEIVRDDGVHTRFDTQSGAFVAFDRDLVLRTFFKPNDGRRYFERQANKEHE